ncbi:MAG: hypothetical protein J5704_02315 [Paludibacteraceae bacterium]|nr:hypothetical protein [Paludibacteraceae bacterium]
MIDRNKSAARSEAGKALVTISGVVLFFGIVASIIIFIASFHSEWNGVYHEDSFDWTGLASAIEVLFGSIFIYIFGKTIAKIANYAEAIYKQQNPDYKYDHAIENGCTFMPGDEAIYKTGDSEQKVIIKDVFFESGYIRYQCLFPNGEVEVVRTYNLREVED